MATYHVIPHTHWDREWYLAFDQFRVLLVHLMEDLLAILEEQEDYTGFLLDGQTVVADDYLDVMPERRETLTTLVQEGRLWMGPWYVLPDTFLVSGEALLRNLMRGRAAARAFGQSMDIGYIPDSFGHTAQIPQILQGFGMDTAIVWRGFGGEPGQESSEYRWKSPDGTTVLMEHLSEVGYSAAYFDTAAPEAVRAYFDRFKQYVDPRAQTAERLVLSGGDHHWPTEHLPEAIRQINAIWPEDQIVHSSLSGFAEALKEGVEGRVLPEVEGELRFGYRWAFNVTGGVYSSRMYIKQANAAGQRLLERYLEPLNALAVQAGGRSQRSLIEQGWTYLLQNHPHDSICGCSIDAVHREMMTRFEKLEALGEGVSRFAWMALAPDQEGDSGDDRRITFFNPSPFARSTVATCTVEFFQQEVVVGLNPDVVPDAPKPPVAGFVLRDVNGSEVPYEIVHQETGYGIAYTRYGYPAQSRVERFELRVPLEALPALGLRDIHVVRTDTFPVYESPASLQTEERAIENDFLRVEAMADGSFYVTDKHTGYRFGPLGYFEDGADAGDEYNYSPPPHDQVMDSREAVNVSVEVVLGIFKIGLRVSGSWALPVSLTDDLKHRASDTCLLTFVTEASLDLFSRAVTFETTIDNTARDHRLRVLFETGRQTNQHHADNAFAILSREQKRYDPNDFAIEVPAAVAPMHRFVIVEDDEAGATVIADGLPEYELKHDSGGVLTLTLLRCVGELGRDGLMMRPGGQGGWRNATPEAQCLGQHHFKYAFLPYSPGWEQQVDLIQESAERLLLPVQAQPGKTDSIQADRPFLQIEPSSLVLSACKEAAQGDGLVLRVYNPTPKTIEGKIWFADIPAEVQRVNLEERSGAPLTLQGHDLHDTWPPFRIHTYRLHYAAAG